MNAWQKLTKRLDRAVRLAGFPLLFLALASGAYAQSQSGTGPTPSADAVMVPPNPNESENTLSIGNGAIGTNQVSVGATATKIVDVRFGRGVVTIVNHGTVAVYLGTSNVTTTTGLLLPGVVGANITIQTQAAVYGVVATGTQTVSFLEAF